MLKFNLTRIFLLVLLFLPLAVFSSETKKERLEFIKNIERRLEKDLPTLEMERKYTLLLDAGKELHRFYFPDYATKYLNKAIDLKVTQSKVPAYLKLLGIYHQQNRLKQLKVTLISFKKYLNQNPKRKTPNVKNADNFYTFVVGKKTPEETFGKEEIKSIEKSFLKSEFRWLSFDRYLMNGKWDQAFSLIDFKNIRHSSPWTQIKADLVQAKKGNFKSAPYCSAYYNKNNMAPEHLLCGLILGYKSSGKIDKNNLQKLDRSLRALKPEYHWFYNIIKELET